MLLGRQASFHPAVLSETAHLAAQCVRPRFRNDNPAIRCVSLQRLARGCAAAGAADWPSTIVGPTTTTRNIRPGGPCTESLRGRRGRGSCSVGHPGQDSTSGEGGITTPVLALPSFSVCSAQLPFHQSSKHLTKTYSSRSHRLCRRVCSHLGHPSSLAAADGMQRSRCGQKPHEHLVDLCRTRMTGHFGRQRTAAACAYLRRPRGDVGLRAAAGPRSGPVTACHTTAMRSGRVEMGSGGRRSARTGRRGQPRHDDCGLDRHCGSGLLCHPAAGVSDSAADAMSQPLGRQAVRPLLNNRDDDARLLVLLCRITRRCYDGQRRFTMRGRRVPKLMFLFELLRPDSPANNASKSWTLPRHRMAGLKPITTFQQQRLVASSPCRGKGNKRLNMDRASGMHQGEEKERPLSIVDDRGCPHADARLPPVFTLISCIPPPAAHHHHGIPHCS